MQIISVTCEENWRQHLSLVASPMMLWDRATRRLRHRKLLKSSGIRSITKSRRKSLRIWNLQTQICSRIGLSSVQITVTNGLTFSVSNVVMLLSLCKSMLTQMGKTILIYTHTTRSCREMTDLVSHASWTRRTIGYWHGISTRKKQPSVGWGISRC